MAQTLKGLCEPMNIMSALDIAEGRAKVVEMADWRSAAQTLASALRVYTPPPIELTLPAGRAAFESFFLQNDDLDERLTLPRARLMPIIQALVESQQTFTFCRDEEGTWLTISGPAYAAITVTLSMASPKA